MKIVYTDMVGDLFHYGHINALEQSKSFGNYLIVGVHNDETVESYKRKPVMNMEQRVKVIENCKFVDKVIRNAPLKITEEYLKEHKIDVVSITNTRPDEQNKKMYGIPMELGIIKKFKYTRTVSTSDIIENIKLRIKNNTL
jgi:cytidyltransferase-like protein